MFRTFMKRKSARDVAPEDSEEHKVNTSSQELLDHVGPSTTLKRKNSLRNRIRSSLIGNTVNREKLEYNSNNKVVVKGVLGVDEDGSKQLQDGSESTESLLVDLAEENEDLKYQLQQLKEQLMKTYTQKENEQKHNFHGRQANPGRSTEITTATALSRGELLQIIDEKDQIIAQLTGMGENELVEGNNSSANKEPKCIEDNEGQAVKAVDVAANLAERVELLQDKLVLAKEEHIAIQTTLTNMVISQQQQLHEFMASSATDQATISNLKKLVVDYRNQSSLLQHALSEYQVGGTDVAHEKLVQELVTVKSDLYRLQRVCQPYLRLIEQGKAAALEKLFRVLSWREQHMKLTEQQQRQFTKQMAQPSLLQQHEQKQKHEQQPIVEKIDTEDKARQESNNQYMDSVVGNSVFEWQRNVQTNQARYTGNEYDENGKMRTTTSLRFPPNNQGSFTVKPKTRRRASAQNIQFVSPSSMTKL
eukprot:m.23043 g.23043  ORF g.23043 m.23043 type:complete len:476 (+) comp5511_c0_seq1:341-1768(+)